MEREFGSLFFFMNQSHKDHQAIQLFCFRIRGDFRIGNSSMMLKVHIFMLQNYYVPSVGHPAEMYLEGYQIPRKFILRGIREIS